MAWTPAFARVTNAYVRAVLLRAYRDALAPLSAGRRFISLSG